ncbi:MAG: hypothetical protein HYX29_03675 [Solirubrobacterales bacterium]|nr:hypothetical protein [Solirubrobacterales bacterium]
MSGLTYDTRIGNSGGLAAPLHRLIARVRERRAVRAARGSSFEFEGKQLDYFIAPFNQTWDNERCVELAIIEDQLKDAGLTLEVGNVYAHYKDHDHAVVDKYEVAPGVRNLDVIEIPISEQYDFIFSISTMEHVGWDETPRDPEKFIPGVQKLQSLLAPGGKLIITLPVGWNEWLDEQFQNDAIEADRIDWFERTARLCSWRNSSREVVAVKEYGAPYSNANGLVVLTINGS